MILARWLANKTPGKVASRIASPDASMLVAVDPDAILAVGSVTGASHFTLNHVSPDARFQGISRALPRALEAGAMERGDTRHGLNSVETARAFFFTNG